MKGVAANINHEIVVDLIKADFAINRNRDCPLWCSFLL
jgi:hypothetical protein